nr:late embryogenesis abundant protein, LEA-14 [Tanacetum cinerariifolium]
MFVDVSYPLTVGKDVSNPFMAVMVCQKPLGYFSSPMIHVPRAELVFNPPGYVVPAGRVGYVVIHVVAFLLASIVSAVSGW